MSERYWIETLGCPKNEVDSEKLVGTLDRDGMLLADSPESADLVVVNTCAFIEDARKEYKKLLEEGWQKTSIFKSYF